MQFGYICWQRTKLCFITCFTFLFFTTSLIWASLSIQCNETYTFVYICLFTVQFAHSHSHVNLILEQYYVLSHIPYFLYTIHLLYSFHSYLTLIGMFSWNINLTDVNMSLKEDNFIFNSNYVFLFITLLQEQYMCHMFMPNCLSTKCCLFRWTTGNLINEIFILTF